jgi:hypothetical protein
MTWGGEVEAEASQSGAKAQPAARDGAHALARLGAWMCRRVKVPLWWS